jgi:hypothetical protein
MSLIINNILNPIDVGTISPGNLGLFAGPGDVFYAKKSDGSTYPVTSTVSGFNSSLIFNTFSYVLSITDGNSTQTASLIDLASGYYNDSLSFSTSSNVLTLIDGFSTLTASLSYYDGGFNTSISYNTASNVLSISDGKGTISATLSLTGANTSLTFNPFDNVLSIVDGFSTKTASMSLLSGNTGLSFSVGILTLQDGRGTLTASISSSESRFTNVSKITLTQSQIIAASSSPVLLVDSPGTFSVIDLVSFVIGTNFGSASFVTQSSTDSLDGNLWIGDPNTFDPWVTLSAAFDIGFTQSGFKKIFVNSVDLIQNSAIYFQLQNSLIGGTGSTIDFYLTYNTLP